MKNTWFILAFMIFSILNAQEQVDVGTPINEGMSPKGDLKQTMQNSINESTGKVNFSIPLGTIAAYSVNYSVQMSYSSKKGYDVGKKINKYSPTSIVGVGWDLDTPRIVVDHKNTAVRDDDEFYLIDGSTSTRLICTDKTVGGLSLIWEFQMEKYAPWKIQFVQKEIDDINGQLTVTDADYWKIIKEDGMTYYYGYDDNQYTNNPSSTSNSKENLVAWGNWIGDSKQSGGSKHTIVWNLSRIVDQWNNRLDFTYDLVQIAQSGSVYQTEASYLNKIESSNGARIQLTYGNKNSVEYYEPHKESSEPDAYQERYEKKYLQNIKTYNNNNQLISTHDLTFTLNGTGSSQKRYLTRIDHEANLNGMTQDGSPYLFDYNYSGDYKGCMKKVTYPTGGSATYHYEKKFLFTNSSNNFTSSITWPTGYELHSKLIKDNYSLYLLKTTDPISGGKYRFKIFRFWWNGQSWDQDEFTFPHLIEDGYFWDALKNFYCVFEDNFYALAYDRGSYTDLYLFHLEKDGRSWDYSTKTSLNVGGSSDNSNDPPALLSGNDFVALATHKTGYIYTYVWNDSYWNYKRIDQGSGQFYLAATNNYIVSLDEDGGTDMITSVSYTDNYYLHYLDAEKNWQTNSWSAFADPYIAGIEEASFFYPDNSTIGFMADDNPEFFFRWDTNYNLIAVDNVLGGYTDTYPMQSVSNNMFTIFNNITKRPYKTARFNGVGWSVTTPSSTNQHAFLQFGEDLMNYQGLTNYDFRDLKYYLYNANANSWHSGILTYDHTGYSYYCGSAINRDFVVLGRKVYARSNSSFTTPFSQIGSLNNDIRNAYSNGLFYTYIDESNAHQGKFVKIDKTTGLINFHTLAGLHYDFINVSPKWGGNSPYMSQNTISLNSYYYSTTNPFYVMDTPLGSNQLFRIIDDDINNSINDIVVNHVEINDDNGESTKVMYTYSNPSSTPDNSTIYYCEVQIENKGYGTGNIGKIVKTFDDGKGDLRLIGLPLHISIIDGNNNIVKDNFMTWNIYTKSLSNGSYTIAQSYYTRLSKENEKLYFEGQDELLAETNYGYNSLGLKSYTYTKNSKNETVRKDYTYAYQQYSLVSDKNMLTFPYEIKTKINSQFVNVERFVWANSADKAYITESWSGPTTTSLRLNHQISSVDFKGNVVESNNGKGLFQSVLYGYNYQFEVAMISNATYQEVVNALDVSVSQLNNLNTTQLKTELLKLYDRLPNANISLSFFNDNGWVTNEVDQRKDEINLEYDPLGRLIQSKNKSGELIEKRNYFIN